MCKNQLVHVEEAVNGSIEPCTKSHACRFTNLEDLEFSGPKPYVTPTGKEFMQESSLKERFPKAHWTMLIS